MTLIPVEYHGVHSTGPEHFSCVLLRWAEHNRILPIWMSPLSAAELEARDEGFVPRRPGTPDLMAEMSTRLTSGVTAVNIISHFEGVFIASVVFNDGEEIDARPSDAIKLARALELDIQVEEDVLTQASFFVSDDALEEYFGLRLSPAAGSSVEDDLSASGDAQADADFEEMMRSLGMDENDFLEPGGDGADGADDTDVTKGDNG
ncbi:hypothetical protein CATRI_06240 [Corynebacterium atrinae]|uniref:bifunctional nuclease family protein n=1 Tax=Corynebacterium atrinae TaxID=1336740 RepID=UPI0025B57C36|nr:bifunctional nuclease family protein [Corynebacterium atrinae]WJY63332.1 hypothetical protein CATRI_06240 [Corynebacterium atrinae]